MNSKDIKIQGLGFVLTATGLLKVLWNKLFPELFGWKKITYWQSVMLYVICKALFDFRYTIKDSFNFGNNSINGESVGKKNPAKSSVKTTETTTESTSEETEETCTENSPKQKADKKIVKEVKKEMKKEIKKEDKENVKDAKKTDSKAKVKEEIEVEMADDDAQVLEFSKKEKK